MVVPRDDEPVDAPSAAVRWVSSWRPGGHRAPPLAVLAAMYETQAEAAGWRVGRVAVKELGRQLRRLGYQVKESYGRWHPLVSRATAEALWAAAPPGATRYAQVRSSRPSRAPPRAQVPPFHAAMTHNARPVVDVWGAVYPSASVAAMLLRVTPQRLATALRRNESCAGRAWRYLAPHEVAAVPPGTRAGERVEWLAWRGTVAVRCPRCGTAGDQVPPPAGFPPPPA